MKSPKRALIVDASVLIACARGRSSFTFDLAIDRRSLIVTDRVVTEAQRRIELGLKTPELNDVLDNLLQGISIIFTSELAGEIANAGATLRDAVASRNGSTSDAHVLAAAWIADADIWSFDRDFAGTGVASWSTTNLVRALLDERHTDSKRP